MNDRQMMPFPARNSGSLPIAVDLTVFLNVFLLMWHKERLFKIQYKKPEHDKIHKFHLSS